MVENTPVVDNKDIENAAYNNEQLYLSALRHLVDKMKHEQLRDDRTGVGTVSEFMSTGMVFDIANTVPLLNTKFVSLTTIVHELIWMISGDNSIRYLKENGVNIWDEWLVPNTARYTGDKLVDGITSSIYGESWRRWTDTRIVDCDDVPKCPLMDKEGRPEEMYQVLHEFDGKAIIQRTVDQLQRAIWQLRYKPTSRRIILNGWNASRVSDVTLPPCHVMAQFYVDDGKLSCKMYQRSADIFLGVPYNIVQYSVLTYILAAITGLRPDKFIWVPGDLHLYSNHLAVAEQQLAREVQLNAPRLRLEGIVNGMNIDDVTADMIQLDGLYNPQSALRAKVAV